jgi:hypothetical protein
MQRFAGRPQRPAGKSEGNSRVRNAPIHSEVCPRIWTELAFRACGPKCHCVAYYNHKMLTEEDVILIGLSVAALPNKKKTLRRKRWKREYFHMQHFLIACWNIPYF